LDGTTWAAIIGLIGGAIVIVRHKAIVRQANEGKTTPGQNGVLPIRTQELVALFVGLVMLIVGLAAGIAWLIR
jgi:hypothetical protein